VYSISSLASIGYRYPALVAGMVGRYVRAEDGALLDAGTGTGTGLGRLLIKGVQVGIWACFPKSSFGP
ncbi:MAG: hypothetical protein ACE5LL_03540, partial [Alphaproteobacteria bacterium]